jgi:hypothetical protein
MKRQALLSLAGCLAVAVSACNHDWVTFESPDQSFTVLMPVKPVMKSAPSGPSYRAVAEDITYIISTAPVPAEYQSLASTEKLFDSLQKAAVGSDKPPKSTKRITLGPAAHPGREILFDRGGGVIMRGRAYRLPQSLLFLTVFAPTDKAMSADVERFLESLTLR